MIKAGAVQDDPNRFSHFSTPEHGISALAKNLLEYDQKGINTVHDVISKWAPASDHNNTQAYIHRVAEKLGVSADAKLDMQDPGVLRALTEAIITQENGKQPYSDKQLSTGIGTALSGSKGKNIS